MEEEITLRPEVQRFAEQIELRLRKHDHDRGDSYKKMDNQEVVVYALSRLNRLADAIYQDTMSHIIREQAGSLGAAALFAFVLRDK